jgi:hypothetical protein
MENSSIPETDKEEKEHATQDPGLSTGECHLLHLEQMWYFDLLVVCPASLLTLLNSPYFFLWVLLL